jgi:hypothetical protein
MNSEGRVSAPQTASAQKPEKERTMEAQEVTETPEDKAYRAEITALYSKPIEERKAIDPVEVVQPETKIEPETVDPWAGVPATLRTTIENAQYRLKQAEQRIGSLQNELHAAKTAAAKVVEAPTPEEVSSAAKSAEKWNELKSEFPEWGEAIDSRLAAERAEYRKTTPDLSALKAELEGAVGNTKAEIAASVERMVELAKLEIRHPDYELIKEDQAFHAWLKAQDEAIQDKALRSTKARDASEVIDLYKSTNKKQPVEDVIAERQQRLRQSQSVQGRNAIPAKSEADMTELELRRYYAAKVFPKTKG